MKDISNTCAVEKIFGTTYGELPAVPKSLVGENKDDRSTRCGGFTLQCRIFFLKLAVQCRLWRYCFFAEAVTGSREEMDAV